MEEKILKILLSAYSCEPNKGSEPGVGWNYAVQLSQIHDVWVITKKIHQPYIEDYVREHHIEKIQFIYVDVPKYLVFWKKNRRGMRLHNAIWQYRAYKKAKVLNKDLKFDIVHHVTFVSYTQNTYMYKLGIPMIWGPVAGGENIPKSINLKNLSLKNKLIENIRKISQVLLKFQPCIIKTMKKAKYIIVATDETLKKIPEKFHYKTIILPAITLENPPIETKRNSQNVKIIMSGRLIYWKAFDIGINAFLKIVENYNNLELYILGTGEEKKRLEDLCGEYLNEKIHFVNYISHDKIYEFYKDFDIYLNTTLRDSGCMNMMEAMSVGLPCIAIKTGGPGLLMEYNPNLQIIPTNYENCILHTAKKLEYLLSNNRYIEERNLSTEWLLNSDFCVENKLSKIQEIYNRAVNLKY